MVSSTTEKLHRVFPVERRGDTLVVTPRGDATGFGTREMESELQMVLAILEEPATKNVIVDLKASNYFGSQMIGAVNSMVLKVQEAGGKSGVCDVSTQMEEGLKIMHIHELWPLYDTRKEAAAAILTESVSAKLAAGLRTRRGKALLAMAVISVVAIVLTIVIIRRQPTAGEVQQEAFQSLTGAMAGLREKRNQVGISEVNWKIFSHQSREKVREIIKRLKENDGDDEQVKKELLQAAHDCLLPILKKAHEPSPQLEEQFDRHMARAKKRLGAGENR